MCLELRGLVPMRFSQLRLRRSWSAWVAALPCRTVVDGDYIVARRFSADLLNNLNSLDVTYLFLR